MIHIITGLPGAGKTTVTKYLAKKLSAEVINTDELHSILYPKGAHTKTGDFTQESLKNVYSCLRPLAYYLSKASSKHFVFEGSFRLNSQRSNVTSILEENDMAYSIILVTAGNDADVKNRLESRIKTGHAGDYQHYLDIKKVFEFPEKAYLIENVGTLKDLHNKVNSYLAECVSNL